MNVTIDSVMRAIVDARVKRRTLMTEAEWDAWKKNPIHRASLRLVREDAIQMIEDGEFD